MLQLYGRDLQKCGNAFVKGTYLKDSGEAPEGRLRVVYTKVGLSAFYGGSMVVVK